jgi:hypothetical protein
MKVKLILAGVLLVCAALIYWWYASASSREAAEWRRENPGRPATSAPQPQSNDDVLIGG